jgi:hypothetical protein
LDLPTDLIKKKSKSIDNSQKYQSVSISKTKKKMSKNHSMLGGLGNSLEKREI